MTNAASGTEALIRSPLGEIRVWIEDGTVKTSVRLDFADAAAALQDHDDLARVAASMEGAVQRLAPTARTDGAASPVTRWLAARCDAAPGVRTPASDLFRDFVLWCDANGYPPINQKAFGTALGDRGYRNAGKSHAGLTYRGGLRLKPSPVGVAAESDRRAA